MVLEDASPSGGAFTSDSPASDVDVYASTPSVSGGASTAPQDLKWDLSQSPKALPFLGPLFGFSHQKLVNVVSLDVARCSALVGRPVTQQEFDAISFYCAKMNAISSYGGPVGVLGGIWRAQNSKSTFRFPFWQPDYKPGQTIEEGMFDPKKLGPLRGMQAEAAWHALRRTAYALIGGSVGLAVFGAYATSVAIAGQRMDERMKDIMSALQSMTPDERRVRVAQASRARPQQPQSSQQRQYDQAFSTNTSMGGDADQQRQSQSAQEAHLATRQSSSPRQRQSRGVDFDFDDASPQRNDPSSPVSTGDPWEALRQNARNGVRFQTPAAGAGGAWAGKRAGQDGDIQRDQDRGSALGDSFSFSKRDEERQLAKEEAQRDFDARIERERKGQDFNDSSKRW